MSTAPPTGTTPDLSNPHWLPFDIDLTRGIVQWLECDEALIEASTFLDPRMPAAGRKTFLAPASDLASLQPVDPGPVWLWHTSFCGSTLLARLLHVHPYTLSLREPLVLRRLADARAAGFDIAPWIAPVVALLARPWHAGGQVVIKPTHAALNVAVDLVRATPQARSVVLTSTLEEFLVSHLKKAPETLARIGLLTERALHAGALARSRGVSRVFRPPGLLAAAALQWCAQRELVQDLLDAKAGRTMVLSWAELRHDIRAGTAAAAQHLGLTIPASALSARVSEQGNRHAKAPGRHFDVSAFEAEAASLRQRYAREISDAVRWAEAEVFGLMRPNALRA